jgi:purine-nucleoside phosphorylase
VENIMRIGSAGAMQESIKVRDIVLAMGACTDSAFASQFHLNGTFSPIASYPLLKTASSVADSMGIMPHCGNVLSSDIFYNADPEASGRWAAMGVMCVEMETAALYMTAARCKKNALGILTISDHLLTGESTTAEERQTSFTKMMELALETAIRL